MAAGSAGSAGRGTPPIEAPEGAQSAVSDEDKAKAEAESAAEARAAKAAESAEDRFILYTGPRNIVANTEELKKRSPRLGEGTAADISPQQWAQCGIKAKSPETLVWNVFNNYRVPASKFSREQLEYLLANSKRFELVDKAGKKVKL